MKTELNPTYNSNKTIAQKDYTNVCIWKEKNTTTKVYNELINKLGSRFRNGIGVISVNDGKFIAIHYPHSNSSEINEVLRRETDYKIANYKILANKKNLY